MRLGGAAIVFAAATMVSLVLSGYGDTTSQPAWVAGHPDTVLLSFQTTAPGVCAITVQYLNDAPALVTAGDAFEYRLEQNC